jgi:hypothetical protein
MIIPSKYENLNKCILILGVKIIKLLKLKPYNIEFLYNEINKEENIGLEIFYNTLTFLWLADIIKLTEHQLFLNK